MPIISPDKSGRIDPVVYDILKGVTSEIPIVPITRLDNFQFNEELRKCDKWIAANYVEFDWDFKWQHGTPVFGKNAHLYTDKFNGDEWDKFIDFANSKPPVLTLQRELLLSDVSETVVPIDYPCWHPVPPTETKEQFDNRLISATNIWGLSHEDRKRVHGEIWVKSGKHNYVVCDNISNLSPFLQNEQTKSKWVSQNTPWYSRYPMEDIMEITGMSKITLSLPGAGKKCFRMSEASINSVMYKWEDNIAYAYQWEGGKNCITSLPPYEVQSIYDALSYPNLYEIYCEGVEVCRKYFLPTYIENYINPMLNKL
jgi:hypothetical protein